MAVSLHPSPIGARFKQAALSIPLSLLLASILAAAGLVACGGGASDTVQITTTRLGQQPSHVARTGLDMLERTYGAERVAAERARAQANRPGLPPSQTGEKPLLYDVPEGWEELPPAQFRDVNLRLLRDPSAEIVLTFLANDGGGLRPNVDRWRGQVGMAPMTDADVQALKTRTVFNQPATYVELFGPYQGMRGPRIEEGGIFGAIFSRGGGTLFVKMTGTQEVLEAERGQFHAFLDSLEINMAATTAAQPHAQAGGTSGHAGPPPTTRRSPLEWAAPEGWTEEPSTSQFREVTFRRGALEMYVSTARGNALDNITRWAGQIGQPALDDAALAELERADMMGRSGYIYEAEGALRGMGAPTGKPGQAMLAALVEGSGQIVTVKLTGKAADVRAARPDFMALVASLKAR